MLIKKDGLISKHVQRINTKKEDVFAFLPENCYQLSPVSTKERFKADIEKCKREDNNNNDCDNF